MPTYTHPFIKHTWTFLFWMIIASPLSWAELNVTHLKGATSFLGLTPQCDYLSPETPLFLLKKGNLNYLFKYGDAADPQVNFITTAFNSVSESSHFFQINPLAKNVAILLPPSVIGKLLGELASGQSDSNEFKKIILEDSDFKKNLLEMEQKRAAAEFARDQYVKAHPLTPIIDQTKSLFSKVKVTYQSQTQAMKRQLLELQSCSEQTPDLEDQLNTLQGQISALKKHFETHSTKVEESIQHASQRLKDDPQFKALSNQMNRYKFTPKELDSFLSLFLKAYKQEKDSRISPATHRMEQALLSIGWLNGASKTDLLKLYQHLPKECFSEQGSENLLSQEESVVKKRAAFLKEHYTEKNYIDLITPLEAIDKLPDQQQKSAYQQAAQALLSHPEQATLLAMGGYQFGGETLPVVSYTNVSFKHPKTGQTVQMPDCMESSLLNKLVNDLSGKTGEPLAIRSLQQNLDRMGYEMHPGLQSFLSKYSELNKLYSAEAHQDWAELVSAIPRVTYNPLHPDYEVMPTVSNILAVYEHLLFYRKKSSELPNYSDLSRTKKMDQICQALSRPDRKVGWSLSGSTRADQIDATPEELTQGKKKDSALLLNFSINGIPAYDWKLDPEHSDLLPREDALSTHPSTPIASAMADQLAKGSGISPASARTLSLLLHSQNSSQTLKQLETKKTESPYLDILRSTAGSSMRFNLLAAQKLASLGRLPEIANLIMSLPREEVDKLRTLYSTLADHQFPYRDEETTRSGATFRKVLRHTALGEAWRDPRGLSWGGVVKEPRGAIKKALSKDAEKHCLDLNSPDQRTRVQEALQRINSNETLQSLRKKIVAHPEERGRLLAQFTELKKSTPISGCYLPLLEDYLLLGVDFGDKPTGSEKTTRQGIFQVYAGSNSYIPQFLPNFSSLNGTRPIYPTSTTIGSGGEGRRLLFHSEKGFWTPMHLDDDERIAFRCVCQESNESAGSSASAVHE